MSSELPLFDPSPIAIIGPTASGKSSLAIEVAKSIGSAEILSVDAMAVYTEMSIGTAKVSPKERQEVSHNLIDLVSVTDDFTVAEFQRLASIELQRLHQDNTTPVLAGGTGLYVRSVVDNFTMPPAFPEIRQSLEANYDTKEMFSELTEIDPEAASKIEPTNRRRIIRAMEVAKGTGKKFSSFGPGVDNYEPTQFCQVGLEIDRKTLDQRIDDRLDWQFENGFVQEAAALLEIDGGLSTTAKQALGYAEIFKHLSGELSLEEALDEAKLRTKRFARRQQRWFRRDARIKWFSFDSESLLEDVTSYWHSVQ